VIERILVATDRSDTATRAVAWAAEMSGRFSADLLALRVVPPEHLTGQDGDSAIQAAADDLAALTRRVGGERGPAARRGDRDQSESRAASAVRPEGGGPSGLPAGRGRARGHRSPVLVAGPLRRENWPRSRPVVRALSARQMTARARSPGTGDAISPATTHTDTTQEWTERAAGRISPGRSSAPPRPVTSRTRCSKGSEWRRIGRRPRTSEWYGVSSPIRG
jgi:hypothetical protein